MGKAPKIVDILFAERTVQTKQMPHFFPIDFPGALPEHDIDGIARDPVDQGKYQGNGSEENRDGDENSAENVTPHAVPIAGIGP